MSRLPRPVRSSARLLAARLLAALFVVLGLVLAGCGGGEETGAQSAEASDTEHNQADVEFASQMIQHHAQALAMVDTTRARTLDPEFAQLAEAVREAQAPEIETMTGWLTVWDEPIPSTMRDHANAGHGDTDPGEAMEGTDHDMAGMMTPEEMSELSQAQGADFRELWLEMMIEHHEGAVEMARTQLVEGRYRPALELAEQIIESQEAEIETMKQMLG